jgi:hypothetical protein
MLLEKIEPLVPKSYSDHLLNLTTGNDFPWYWNENTSGYEKTNSKDANFEGFQYGFYHMLYYDGKQMSSLFDEFKPLLYFMEEKTGVSANSIYRVRAALNTWSPNDVQHHAHVDMKSAHNVLLYYINDSDGDTFMYNEVHELGSDSIPSDFTLHSRHTPKQGNAVLFDGLRYHSSSKPKEHSKRIIVNIDFF